MRISLPGAGTITGKNGAQVDADLDVVDARAADYDMLLLPGEHRLLLILGDKDHIPHSPPVMSEQIKVTVE